MSDEVQPQRFPSYTPAQGEAYMSPAQLKHFRKILESIRKDLVEDIDRTVHAIQDEPTTFADPNDRASQESDLTLELRSRDREGRLVGKINDALKHIEEKEYGYCEECGVEIGLKRLEARPTATLCIDCKTLEEIREKQSSR